MAGDRRFVVIGLARARASWFRDVTGWANDAVIPVEFQKCIGAAEVRARLAGGIAVSALLVDEAAPGLDRSLIAAARSAGAAVLVIGDTARTEHWMALGANDVLSVELTPQVVAAAIERHARVVAERAPTASAVLDSPGMARSGRFRGRLTTVIGGGGAGTSTVAMAIAQGLADQSPSPGDVLLADLALRAHLAMYHDAGDVIPGLQELVEAHRRGHLGPSAVRDLTYASEARRYRLLLGLRRPRDWTVLRASIIDPALESLRSAFRHVVVDVDVDLDGETETGSADLEDRTSAARCAVESADLVVVVVDASLKGLHDGAGVVRSVAQHRGHGDGLTIVINRCGRSKADRAHLVAALAELVTPVTTPLSPILLGTPRGIESAHRTGGRLPAGLTEPLAVVTMTAASPHRASAGRGRQVARS